MTSLRLTERFGIRHPIVCAPMAFVTGGSIAAAVSRATGWESSVRAFSALFSAAAGQLKGAKT